MNIKSTFYRYYTEISIEEKIFEMVGSGRQVEKKDQNGLFSFFLFFYNNIINDIKTPIC